MTAQTYRRLPSAGAFNVFSAANFSKWSVILRRKRYDWRFRPVTVWFVVLVNWGRYVLLRRFAPRSAVASLLNAHKTLQKLSVYDRRADGVEGRLLAAILREFGPDGPGHRWLDTDGGTTKRERERLQGDGIVLKAPRWSGDEIVEKGVLLLKYVESMETFRRCVDVASVMRHYVIVLEPSWSGYAEPWLLYYTRFREFPVVIMSPHEFDTRLLNALDGNLVSVELGSAGWTNPELFRPLPGGKKTYDVVMVARAG